MEEPLHCVLFDLDGVLADYDRQARVAHLAALIGVTPDAVHAAIYESGVEEAGDSGVLDAAAYLAALGDHLQRPVPADAWVEARRVATQARPAVIDVASRLQGRVTLGLLTNNGHLMADQLPRIVPELFPLFAGRAYAAARFGAAKPAAAAYLGCLAELGVLPARTLFIDDSAANVDGARAAGLHAHHYQDRAGLRQALIAFGLG
ncbi:HAD-IA family hydrolase [Dyella sp. BiH032]|uniref:HAD-IA family hydrolase n=1 Tax=Dyella sp. BiH032 TaxID=3075430 RepID=UPI0028929AF0|nr:HAD-IA family hydrolase [Dyella sp. BiH032]WNL45822.1 HAD-IA family hydrolase [Dyella sp. BiH032]